MRKRTRATLREVADVAKLHPSTVSRILRGDDSRGSPATRARVFEAVKQLEYRPDFAARSLRTRRSFTLGLVIPDVRDTTHARIYMGAEAAARRRGYHVLISPVGSDRLHRKEDLEYLMERSVDGVLVATARIHDPLLEQFEKEGMSFVLVSRRMEGPAPHAVADNELGMRLATRHLIELGHRRIGFIKGISGVSTTEERLRGYLSALADANLPPDEELIVGGRFDAVAAAAATQELLDGQRLPTAIAVSDDMMAVAACRVLKEAGLKVPNDVSVIGFNDLPIAALVDPPLSTVSIQLERIGELATDMLIDRLDGQEPVGNAILEPELVVRGSTASPSI
jgi:LacI family transcriptional regulator